MIGAVLVSSPGITGVITKLEVPRKLKVGAKINVKLDGDLYNPDFGWYDFWAGCFTVERAGYRSYKIFGGNGEVIGPDWAPTIGIGFMPSSPVTLTVKLWGNPDYWTFWDWGAVGWTQVAVRTVTIQPIGGGAECLITADCAKFGPNYICVGGVCIEKDTGEPPPVEVAALPWKWIAAAGGALVVAVIVAQVAKRR